MCAKNLVVLRRQQNRVTSAMMVALLCFLLTLFASPFKSKADFCTPTGTSEMASVCYLLAAAQMSLYALGQEENER